MPDRPRSFPWPAAWARRAQRLWLCLGAAALAAAWAPARAQDEFTMAISEGTSGGLNHGAVIAKYGGLADILSRAAGRKVQLVFAREFSRLEEGMAAGQFDLVMARPSDYPARGLRDHGYQYVATAKPEGQCLIVTRKDSPLTALAQAHGKRWVLPEKVSYMAKLCAAELRDRGLPLGQEHVQNVREQAAVIFYLDQGLADVGAIASYSGVARNLEKTGHKVLHRSATQPYFPLVAGKRVTPEQVRAMQAALTALPDSEAGRAVLKRIGVDGFDTGTGPRLGQLLNWLGP